jgi:hypothetical protein
MPIKERAGDYRPHSAVTDARDARMSALVVDQRRVAVGLCGAGTGAAAALPALAQEPVSAIVSCGGRPVLAGGALAEVTAPTLRIVGETDGLARVAGLATDRFARRLRREHAR